MSVSKNPSRAESGIARTVWLMVAFQTVIIMFALWAYLEEAR